MKKRQTKAERDAALVEKRRLMAERSEKIKELLRNGAPPNYPVTKLSIEEQIALGIPLDTGWVTTVRLPGRGRRAKSPDEKRST
jgi:hypothetical protein